MIGFIIWIVVGILYFALGVYCFFAKKQVGFWANAKSPKVHNVKAFNRAVGKLWLVFAVIFCLLGLPMLLPQPSAAILLSVVGVMIEVIVLVIVYMKIEQKYSK